MIKFTVTRQINASLETVWEALNDFGDIQRWNPSISKSELTTTGPVGKGSTRHCDFKPLGGVNERIDVYEPNSRMTINLYETFKLPISSAEADFKIEARDGGTSLTLDYCYMPNPLGKLLKGTTDKQMRRGIEGLADSLLAESEAMGVG